MGFLLACHGFQPSRIVIVGSKSEIECVRFIQDTWSNWECHCITVVVACITTREKWIYSTTIWYHHSINSLYSWSSICWSLMQKLHVWQDGLITDIIGDSRLIDQFSMPCCSRDWVWDDNLPCTSFLRHNTIHHPKTPHRQTHHFMDYLKEVFCRSKLFFVVQDGNLTCAILASSNTPSQARVCEKCSIAHRSSWRTGTEIYHLIYSLSCTVIFRHLNSCFFNPWMNHMQYLLSIPWWIDRPALRINRLFCAQRLWVY